MAGLVYITNKIYSLGIDNTITGYMGLIAAPPTAYLWIVRERKKEKELRYKDENQYQERVSELNDEYIEGVNQLYDEKKVLAGAFTLLSLIDEWYYLSELFIEHKNDNNIKIEQIVSVLFSRYDDVHKDELYLFDEIIKDVIIKVIKSQKNSNLCFDWSKFKFQNLGFGLNENEYPGIEMKYKNSFLGANLFRSKFVETDFGNLNFQNVKANKAVFVKSYFNNANLTDSEFIESIFRGAYFMGTKLNGAVLHDSNFSNTNFNNAKLVNTDLSDTNFKYADLSGADLRGAILRNADFTGASLRGAKLKGAIIEDARFNDADITDIDLEGQEFKNSEIYRVTIYNKEIDLAMKIDILSGNLQKYFK